jgi:hypothetical protein
MMSLELRTEEGSSAVFELLDSPAVLKTLRGEG